MNIEQLKYFIEIADVKSISKVSQQSHISQSALSQMMQKLEEYIGYELFIRSNKGVELTKMGEVVYEYAETILRTYEKMLLDLAAINDNKEKVIINSTWAISNYTLPSLLFDLKKKNPHIDYELQSNRSEDIVKNVENGLADIGVIYCDYQSNLLDFIHLNNEKIVLVAKNNLNINNSIDAKELFNFQIIYFKNGCYNKNIRDSLTEQLGSNNIYGDNPLLNLDSISAVKQAVSEGFGISFLPYTAVKKEIFDGTFKQIEVNNLNIILKINIITLKPERISSAAKKVIDFLISSKRINKIER